MWQVIARLYVRHRRREYRTQSSGRNRGREGAARQYRSLAGQPRLSRQDARIDGIATTAHAAGDGRPVLWHDGRGGGGERSEDGEGVHGEARGGCFSGGVSRSNLRDDGDDRECMFDRIDVCHRPVDRSFIQTLSLLPSYDRIADVVENLQVSERVMPWRRISDRRETSSPNPRCPRNHFGVP